MKLKIFVTGGAGYIGSHFIKNCALFFQEQVEILTYDDLSYGYKGNILFGNLIIASLDDKQKLKQTLQEFKPDIVIHFAAYIQVAESNRKPWAYYKNNTENTLYLLKIIEELNIPYFIFSSTAAVYGTPNVSKIKETIEINPINIYGHSKSIIESILMNSKDVLPFKFLTFRYFNVAGADPQARIGQKYKDVTHLIARAMEVATGKREYLPIYGNTYNTPDGTCIRDYIHVEDLVNAHIQGIKYLLEGNHSDIFNLGYSHGFSVLEIIDCVRKVTGHKIPIKIEDAREGDPAVLIADSSKAIKQLNWIPEYDNLSTIIEHAYNFQKTL